MLALRKRGQVLKSGVYRKNLDGNNAVVWKVADEWRAESAVLPLEEASIK
jgi:hypothetical protein